MLPEEKSSVPNTVPDLISAGMSGELDPLSCIQGLSSRTGDIPALTSSLAPLLPLFLQISGKPFSIIDYFMMEPIYRITRPWKLVLKCGRQVAKSTGVAAQSVIQSACTPYFKTLFVLPLFEMTRRLSANYVKPLIMDSPIGSVMVDRSCEQNVLQRSFTNKAQMFFSYAFLNCDRVRGISADCMVLDEVDDLDWSFIPVIAETLSASQWGVHQYSGTPTTFDNTLQALWEDSSRAEWVIRCGGCRHWNISSREFDLLGMLGPVSNVEKYGTGLICSKCAKPIDSRNGQWAHERPDRQTEFSGYHVPQPILPLHYASERKWKELLVKRDGPHHAKFLNECLGESCDVGLKLLTLEELKAAARLDPCDLPTARAQPFTKKYVQRILGVDWGGGGEDEISTTALSIVGVTPDGKHEAFYMERLHTSTSDMEEVQRILYIFNIFQCHYLAHDFAGAGAQHETILIQAGFKYERIIPFSYVAASTQAMITYRTTGIRNWYSLDKARSLMLMYTLLKTQNLLLPDYESSRELLDDFLAFIKHTQNTDRSGDILLIKRQPKRSDDIANATNYACCGHYHTLQKYPDIARSFGVTITPEQLEVAQPPDLEF